MKYKILLVIAFVAFTALGISTFAERENRLEFQKIELQSKQAEIKQLQIDYQLLDKQQQKIQEDHSASQAEVERLQKEKDDLLRRQQELEQQLSAKREAQKLAAAKLNAAASATATASASGVCNTGNASKDFIYSHESSCNPAAQNSGGCYGLGQDCNGLVKNKCGADYACQDAFFTDYMLRRYGSWEKAVSFWQARVPINGKDVGNWW